MTRVTRIFPAHLMSEVNLYGKQLFFLCVLCG